MANRVGSQRGKMVLRRLMLLAKFFYYNTTPEHPADWDKIKRLLETNDCLVSQKTFYADIGDLADIFQLDIGYRRPDGWFVRNRMLGAGDLQTIVNAVQSSPMIPQETADALTEKLADLSDQYTRPSLEEKIHIPNRVKSMNERIAANMSLIAEAIATNRQISFRYFDYSDDGELTDDGKLKKVYLDKHLGELESGESYTLVGSPQQIIKTAYELWGILVSLSRPQAKKLS